MLMQKILDSSMLGALRCFASSRVRKRAEAAVRTKFIAEEGGFAHRASTSGAIRAWATPDRPPTS